MKVLGRAFFAPGQQRQYVDVCIAEDDKELQRLYRECDRRVEGDCRAFTELYEMLPGRQKLGRLVFNWSDCEIPIIVHECVHAAEHFAAVSLGSPAVKKMTRAERRSYRMELLPVLVENLVSQSWTMISFEKNTQI